MTQDEIVESRRICKAATNNLVVGVMRPSDPDRPATAGELVAEFASHVRKTWDHDEVARDFFSVTAPANDGSTEYVCVAMTGSGPTSQANADFIAHARTALPAALDEIDALEAMFERSGRAAEERELELAEAWAERDRYKAALWEILELRPECDQATIANKALESTRDEQGGK